MRAALALPSPAMAHGRFTSAADLVAARIRAVGEARGFAVTRLLTHWEEIVGPSTAAVARPVSVSQRRGAQGATLTIEALGAAALRLGMEVEAIRERVNACYGFAAVAKVRIRQAGPEAFGQAPEPPAPAPDPTLAARAEAHAAGVGDTELRLALAALAANVLGKPRP
jgi:hypothetical protein